MYNEKVMEIFKNPKNVGEVENYNAIGTVGNATCGDIMQITLRIEDGIIKDAKFKTFGCAAAITSSSVATSMIIGKTIDEAFALLCLRCKRANSISGAKKPPLTFALTRLSAP